MKYNKIRMLVTATIIALMVAVIPATPAQASSETITLVPSTGKIGASVTISGWDFTPSDAEHPDRHVDVYFSSDVAVVGEQIGTDVTTYKKWTAFAWVNELGEFSRAFNVPDELTTGDEAVTNGTYHVYVTHYSALLIRAHTTFTVVGGEITIDPDSAPVGTEVEITGEGFGSGEDFTVEYDGDDINIESGDNDADSDGGFTCTIIIPASTAGDHTISVTGEDASGTEATFTVEPEITISPDSGGTGTTVSVNGTGFGGGNDVDIFFDSTEVVTGEDADADGNFATTLTVPMMNPGTYDIEARDEDDNLDRAEFTIGASASLSPTTGNVGTALSISGTGFIAGASVVITYDGIPVTATNATVLANGTFTATINVPASTGGTHTITASDGTNTETLTFVMESEAPLSPVLLEPASDTKAEAQAHLVWSGVTDLSGVTYTLQIASGADFASVVLEKTGLTTSEYTLTSEEKLGSVSKNEPYYWRVKAVDGASNKSGWSTARSFYVGFAFDMPQWAIYVLCGVGALLVGFLGFWLGRKTAYYVY